MGHMVQDNIKFAEMFIDACVSKHGAKKSAVEREQLWGPAEAAKHDVRALLGARMDRVDKIGELEGPAQACRMDRVHWLAARCLRDHGIIAVEHAGYARLMQLSLATDPM